MIVTTTPNKESRSRKRKREVEEASPLAWAVSQANLRDNPDGSGEVENCSLQRPIDVQEVG